MLQGLPNCSYPSPPADGLFVALSPGEYDNAAACGGYLEVHGPDGSVRVEVIDQCPGCGAGHIDLSEAAFSAIAPLNAGLVDVTYQPLVNPSLPGPISLLVKQGSSQYWLALLAMNTGNPLASVQVQSESGGGWYNLVQGQLQLLGRAVRRRHRAVHCAADRHPGARGDGAGYRAQSGRDSGHRDVDVRRWRDDGASAGTREHVTASTTHQPPGGVRDVRPCPFQPGRR